MLGKSKRLIATILTIAMVITTPGVNTFAFSIRDLFRMYSNVTKKIEEKGGDITRRYFESFKKEKMNLLLDSGNEIEINETSENIDANKNNQTDNIVNEEEEDDKGEKNNEEKIDIENKKDNEEKNDNDGKEDSEGEKDKIDNKEDENQDNNTNIINEQEDGEKKEDDTDEKENIDIQNDKTDKTDNEENNNIDNKKQGKEDDKIENNNQDDGKDNNGNNKDRENNTDNENAEDNQTDANKETTIKEQINEEKISTTSELQETEESTTFEEENIIIATETQIKIERRIATDSIVERENIKISTESETSNKKYINGYVSDGFVPDRVKTNNNGSKLFGSSLPTKYDSRSIINNYGVSIVPPVKDQGNYGFCWAFATFGVAETSIRKQNLAATDAASDLSEAALAYFTYKGLEDVTNSTNIDKPGVEGYDYTTKTSTWTSGGNYTDASMGLASYMGMVVEDDGTRYSKMNQFATSGIDGKYAFNNNSFEIDYIQFINTNDEDIIKKAIMENGAVAISYNENRRFWNCRYVDDIGYCYLATDPDDNHGVALVGWDDTIPKEYFYTEETGGGGVSATRDGAWLVRNSWNVYEDIQSDGGYFYMSYDSCINTNAISLKVLPADTYKYNYHYDTLGDNSRDIVSVGCPVGNVFKVSDDFDQKLDAVMIGVYSADASYDIEIYTNDEPMAAPIDGRKKLTQHVTHTTGGFYTVPLDKSIYLKKGTYFSIIVSAKDTSFYILTDRTHYLAPCYYYNEVKPGESFNSDYDGKWRDVNAETTGYDGRSYRIKGLTNEAGGKIEFEPGDAAVVGHMDPEAAEVGKTVELDSNSFRRQGYRFKRWNDGNGNTYADGADITVSSNNTVLTAEWEAITTPFDYNIVYVVDDDVVISEKTTTKTYGQEKELVIPKKPCHKFTAWYVDQFLKEEYDKNTDYTTVEDDTIYVYAKWEPMTYTIRFDENGVDATTPSAITKKYGVSVELDTSLRGTDTNYSVQFWSLDKRGRRPWYGDQQDSTTVDGDVVTLYAIWYNAAITPPKVTFVNDKASSNEEIELDYLGDRITYYRQPEDPSADGFEFLGWFDEEDIEWDFRDDVVMRDVTLTAKWRDISSATEYIFPVDWFDENKALMSKSMLTKMTFLNYTDTVPSDTSASWLIKNSNGLMAYIKGTEIYIHASRNLKIYAPEDSSYLFSDRGWFNPYAGQYEFNLGYCLTNCETIVNLDYIDTSRVKNMSYMFTGFGVERVVTDIFSFDLRDTPEPSTLDISNFDTSNVTDMSNMFDITGIKNIDISHFDTSKVTKMEGMFGMNYVLEKVKMDNIDTSVLVDTSAMFTDCRNLASISFINVDFKNVTDMRFMFESCHALTTLDLSDFDTSNVRQTDNMFSGCEKLTTIKVTDKFVTTNVTSSQDMFLGCDALKGERGTTISGNPIDVSYARIDKVGVPGYFTNGTASSIPVDPNAPAEGYYVLVKNWFDGSAVGISKSSVEKITFLKYNESVPTGAGVIEWDLPNASHGLKGYTKDNDIYIYAPANVPIKMPEDSSYLFSGDVEKINFVDEMYLNSRSNMLDIPRSSTGGTPVTFENLKSIVGLDKLSTEDVTDMQGMFYKCSTLETFDLSNFDTSKVTDMSLMFASGLKNIDKLNLSSFDTSNVTSFNQMFYCSKIKEIDLSSFDTSNALNMGGMFCDFSSDASSSIEKLDISSFNTSKVKMMGHMISAPNISSINISNLDTSNALILEGLFYGMNKLTEIDISNMDISSATNLSWMFANCSNLVTIKASGNFVTYRDTGNMFYGCNSLKGGKGTPYSGDHIDGQYARIDKGPTSSEPGYFTDVNQSTTVYTLTHDWYDSALAGMNETNITSIDISMYPAASPSNVNAAWEIAGSGGLIASRKGTKIFIYAPQTTDSKKITLLEDSSFLFAGRYWEDAESAYINDIEHSFTKCEQITGLNILDTSNVKDMHAMFWSLGRHIMYDGGISGYEDNLLTSPKSISIDVSTFDTHNVTNMSNMFDSSAIRTIDISGFDTYSLTKTWGMFGECGLLETIDLSSFGTATISNAQGMFTACQSLSNINLDGVTFENSTNLSYMFENCSRLTDIDLSSFKTDKVTDLKGMFRGCTGLTKLNLTSFNTASVTEMDEMFQGCTELKKIIVSDKFVTTSVVSSTDMFDSCSKLKGEKGTTISGNPVDVSYARSDTTGTPGYFSLTDVEEKEYILPPSWYNVSASGKGKQYIYRIVFSKKPSTPPSSYDASWEIAGSNGLVAYRDDDEITIYAPEEGTIYAAEDSSYLFSERNPTGTSIGFTDLEYITNIKYLNTSRVTNMQSMFESCQKLWYVSLAQFDTSNVTNMSRMFYYCRYMDPIRVDYFDTSNVEDFSYMFFSCRTLQSIDLSNMNTSKATNMEAMFNSCSSLTSIDVSSFDTSNVTNMAKMFSDCENLTDLDLSNFNTSKVTNMSDMFHSITASRTNIKTIDISSFDTSRVTNMSQMFFDCSKLETIYVSPSFVTTALSGTNCDLYMFGSCSSLMGGRGTLYSESYVNKTYARIDKAGQAGYFTEKGKEVVSISIDSTSTNKTKYKVGEKYDPTGLKIKLNCADSTVESVTYTNTDTKFGFNPSLTTALTKAYTTATISYIRKEVGQGITIIDIDTISINSPPKSSYFVGDKFDPTGLVINLNYDDGTTVESLSYAGHENEFDFDPPITQELVATDESVDIIYKGKKVTPAFDITVDAVEISSVTIPSDGEPSKLNYYVGDTFVADGLKVKVTYNNGDEEEVVYSDTTKTDFTIENANTSSAGTKAVTVKYKGYTATSTFNITVAAVEISTIEIPNDGKPTKLNYFVGDTFDADGLKVKVIYNNGDEEEVVYSDTTKTDFTIENANTSSAGTKAVTVKYKGYTATSTFNITVAAVEISSVTIPSDGKPSKLNYYVGDTFDADGLKVRITYNNGKTEIATYNNATKTDFTIENADTSSAGTKAVTVKYKGKIATPTFDIIVIAVEISSVEIPNDGKPIKLNYYENDVFEADGLKVKVTYNNGIEEDVVYSDTTKTDFTIENADTSSAGTKTVTVKYKGKTATPTFDITVEAVEISSVVIPNDGKPSKLNYFVGDTFNPSGLKVKVTYNNGDIVDVTYSDINKTNFTFENADLSSIGTKTVTVKYKGTTATPTFDITVAAVEISSVTIPSDGKPSKLNYFVGDTFEADGLKVRVIYNNGDEEEVVYSDTTKTDFTIENADTSSAGTKAVTIKYKGYTATTTFNITVAAVEISTIEIPNDGKPTKLNYFVGDTFEADGLKVKVIYNNGDEEEVVYSDATKTDFIIENADTSSAGAKAVTVKYKGYTATSTFNITVAAVEISSVTIPSDGKPSKLNYYVGDTFDADGLKVRITYNNGKSEIATYNNATKTDFTIENADTSSAGTKAVTVKYKGKTATPTFDITVTAVEISSVVIPNDGKPIKLNYYENDVFEADGLKVKVTYNNGAEEDVVYSDTTKTDFTIENADTSSAGTKTVTVKYKGNTATPTFDITVTAVAIDSVLIPSDGKPTKLNYFVGDTFNPSGLKVKVTYNNGDIVDVTYSDTNKTNFAFENADLSSIGTKTITVKYKGETATPTFDITVAAVEISSVTIPSDGKPTKLNYFVGDAFDADGLKVKVIYNNGDEEEVVYSDTTKTDFTIENANTSSAGTKAVTIKYKDYTATSTFNITVATVEISTIEIPNDGKPTKLNYFVGDTFDADGLKVKVIYNNGDEEEVVYSDTTKTDFIIENANTSSAGTKAVTVKYKGHTATSTFNITIVAIVVDTVEILSDGMPNKLNYYEGDTFDPSGLKIKAIYNNGVEEEVIYDDTNKTNFTFVNANLSTAGTKAVTVKYKGKASTTTFNITVTALEIETVEIPNDGKPSKLNYFVGDTFNPSGLKVKVTYNNGVDEMITYNSTNKASFTFENANLSSAGTKAVTVKYKGKTATTTFNITVVAVVISSVEIPNDGKPSKLNYYEEETFNPSGLKVKITYNNGKTELVAYNNTTKGNFVFENTNTSNVGTKVVTVKYKGNVVTNTFSITVTVKKVTFTFDLLGKGNNFNSVVEAGNALTMPSKIPTTKGYTFLYWYENDDSRAYDFNEIIMKNSALKRTLKAKWKPVEYTIKYQVESDVVIATTGFIKVYGIASAKLETPTRSNYVFAGWYTDNTTFNKAYTKDMDIYEEGKTDYIIFAKWNKVEAVPQKESSSRSNSGSSSSSGGSRGGSSPLPAQQAAANLPTQQGNQQVNQSNYGTFAVMKSEPLKNIVAKIEAGQTRFTKENGEKIRGLAKVSIDGKDTVYYFNYDSTIYCGWMKDENNNFHYFGLNGQMVMNDQVKVGDKTYNVNTKGELVQEGLSVEDKQMIFNSCGVKEYTGEVRKNVLVAQTGTQTQGQVDTWSVYIMNPITGQKELAKGVTRLVQEDGVHTYFFDNLGILQTGWQLVDGKWQLFSPHDGRLVVMD